MTGRQTAPHVPTPQTGEGAERLKLFEDVKAKTGELKGEIISKGKPALEATGKGLLVAGKKAEAGLKGVKEGGASILEKVDLIDRKPVSFEKMQEKVGEAMEKQQLSFVSILKQYMRLDPDFARLAAKNQSEPPIATAEEKQQYLLQIREMVENHGDGGKSLSTVFKQYASGLKGKDRNKLYKIMEKFVPFAGWSEGGVTSWSDGEWKEKINSGLGVAMAAAMPAIIVGLQSKPNSQKGLVDSFKDKFLPGSTAAYTFFWTFFVAGGLSQKVNGEFVGMHVAKGGISAAKNVVGGAANFVADPMGTLTKYWGLGDGQDLDFWSAMTGTGAVEQNRNNQRKNTLLPARMSYYPLFVRKALQHALENNGSIGGLPLSDKKQMASYVYKTKDMVDPESVKRLREGSRINDGHRLSYTITTSINEVAYLFKNDPDFQSELARLQQENAPTYDPKKSLQKVGVQKMLSPMFFGGKGIDVDDKMSEVRSEFDTIMKEFGGVEDGKTSEAIEGAFSKGEKKAFWHEFSESNTNSKVKRTTIVGLLVKAWAALTVGTNVFTLLRNLVNGTYKKYKKGSEKKKQEILYNKDRQKHLEGMMRRGVRRKLVLGAGGALVLKGLKIDGEKTDKTFTKDNKDDLFTALKEKELYLDKKSFKALEKHARETWKMEDKEIADALGVPERLEFDDYDEQVSPRYEFTVDGVSKPIVIKFTDSPIDALKKLRKRSPEERVAIQEYFSDTEKSAEFHAQLTQWSTHPVQMKKQFGGPLKKFGLKYVGGAFVKIGTSSPVVPGLINTGTFFDERKSIKTWLDVKSTTDFAEQLTKEKVDKVWK